jgi:hypothetical protein
MRCLTPEECLLWRSEQVSRREWKRQLTCLTVRQTLAEGQVRIVGDWTGEPP